MVKTSHLLLLRNIAFTLLCVMPLLLATTRAGADIALCIIAILFLVKSAISKQWGWTRNPEICSLGALWIFMLAVSWITPIDRLESFKAAFIWGRFILFFAAAR